MNPALRNVIVKSGIIRPGLIAWYKFNEGTGQVLTDYSGRGNHGQLGSTTGSDTNDPSWTSQGLNFNGDDFVVLPALLSTDFTVIIAATITSLGTYDLFSQWASGAAGRLELGLNPTGTLQLSIGGSARSSSPAGTITTGTTIIAVRKSSSNIDLFKNNIQVGNGSYSTQITQTASKLGTYGSGSYLTGLEEYVLIYDRSLSKSEYLQNYLAIKRELSNRGVVLAA